MYSKAYSRMFFGFLFVVLNIRIGGLDILPDFIGYWLVSEALTELSSQHLAYIKAKPFASALIFLSLGSLIQLSNQAALQPSSWWEMGLLVGSQVTLIAELFLFYWICQALFQLGQERGEDWFAASVRSRWRSYLTATVSLLIFLPFLLNLPERWIILYGALALVQIITILFILGILRHAKQILR